MNYFTMYIGQPEVSALKLVGKLFMVKPQLMKYGGVKVMYMCPVLYSVVPDFIRFPITKSFFDTGSRHPHGKGFQMMVSSVIAYPCSCFHHGRPSKFPS